MERCWDGEPSVRPEFTEILAYLEERDRRLLPLDEIIEEEHEEEEDGVRAHLHV
jgi:hypothetical protein